MLVINVHHGNVPKRDKAKKWKNPEKIANCAKIDKRDKTLTDRQTVDYAIDTIFRTFRELKNSASLIHIFLKKIMKNFAKLLNVHVFNKSVHHGKMRPKK